MIHTNMVFRYDGSIVESESCILLDSHTKWFAVTLPCYSLGFIEFIGYSKNLKNCFTLRIQFTRNDRSMIICVRLIWQCATANNLFFQMIMYFDLKVTSCITVTASWSWMSRSTRGATELWFYKISGYYEKNSYG